MVTPKRNYYPIMVTPKSNYYFQPEMGAEPLGDLADSSRAAGQGLVGPKSCRKPPYLGVSENKGALRVPLRDL